MPNPFQADCHPLLIGSLPMTDHRKATDLVREYTACIPLWVQLPAYPDELMIPQFAPGLPGLRQEGGKIFVDRSSSQYESQLLSFYEDYMAVAEGGQQLSASRFILEGVTARGLNALVDSLQTECRSILAVKGQVTGPITFCTGMHDEKDTAIFYDDQLRDAAVKLLTMKARWQIRQLAVFRKPVMIFCDEPALAGYGSSEFISISRDEILDCLREVVDAIHEEGALAGVHVCANTDWSLVLDSAADIISFDAYEYFDRFALYRDQIVKFMNAGNILAWGIVPTLNVENISRETTESLLKKWNANAEVLENMGIKRSVIQAQSLITPSCGAGSLPPELAMKVLRLTREISERLRQTFERESRYEC